MRCNKSSLLTLMNSMFVRMLAQGALSHFPGAGEWTGDRGLWVKSRLLPRKGDESPRASERSADGINLSCAPFTGVLGAPINGAIY